MLTDINIPVEKGQVAENYIRMYYEHQYDRIAKLEAQSMTITNIVISLSIGSLAFGFSDFQNPTLITGLALPIAMIAANLFAIAYVLRTNGFTRVHTKRAKCVLEIYSLDLFQLDKSMPFTYIKFWGLEKIVLYIHIVLILVALLPIYIYL